MVKVWFDTLRLAERLREAGWPPEQADALTAAIHDPLEEDPSSTKLDTLKLAHAFQFMGASWEQAAATARAIADAYAGR